MLTVLEHHAEPLAASNTTFKIDTRDEQAGKGRVARPSANTPKRACARQHLPRLRAPGEALLSPPSFSVSLDEPQDHGKPIMPKTIGLATSRIDGFGVWSPLYQ